MSKSVFNDFTALNDLLIPAFKNVPLCTQVGEPEWWFDVHAGLKKLARKTCYLCPAFAECRAENDRIETQGAESLYGIFAGEDPRERVARRKRERNNKPSHRGYASQCRECGRLVLDQNAVVRLAKDKRRLYACAHCLNKTTKTRTLTHDRHTRNGRKNPPERMAE